RLALLATGADTLVIFMAGAELAGVRSSLLEAGLPASTPAALVESGTLDEQRAAFGTLLDLPSLLDGHRGGPVLVIVGKTVALARELRAPAATPAPRSNARARRKEV